LKILNGSYVYEIGDKGGMILFGKDKEISDSIYYSWDEGLTIKEFNL
jgi:hypothetical protein